MRAADVSCACAVVQDSIARNHVSARELGVLAKRLAFRVLYMHPGRHTEAVGPSAIPPCSLEQSVLCS